MLYRNTADSSGTFCLSSLQRGQTPCSRLGLLGDRPTSFSRNTEDSSLAAIDRVPLPVRGRQPALGTPVCVIPHRAAMHRWPRAALPAYYDGTGVQKRPDVEPLDIGHQGASSRRQAGGSTTAGSQDVQSISTRPSPHPQTSQPDLPYGRRSARSCTPATLSGVHPPGPIRTAPRPGSNSLASCIGGRKTS